MIIHGFSKKSNSENYFREQVRYLNTKKIVGGCIVRLKVRLKKVIRTFKVVFILRSMSWSTKGWNDVMLGVCSRANQMMKEIGLGVEMTLLNH